MQATADTKYAEALAHDIADTLSPNGAHVAYDHDAHTWAVSVHHRGHRYNLLMPAPGAHYALFRDERWCGGINLTTDATPEQVAVALLRRITDDQPAPTPPGFAARLRAEGERAAADPNYYA